MMAYNTKDPLTYDTAKSLLGEEQQNIFYPGGWRSEWSKNRLGQHPDDGGEIEDPLGNSVFMRTFDGCSGSKPVVNGRMLARAPRVNLDNEKIRRETLRDHANHSIWVPTPYISFTSSPAALQTLANTRLARRGDQTIVVVDPHVRLQLELPILNYKTEMEAYNVRPPYNDDYWSNHYLCLFEVTPSEVVGTWEWASLREDPDWFRNTIMPAVEAFRLTGERHFAQRAQNRALQQQRDSNGSTASQSHRTRIVRRRFIEDDEQHARDDNGDDQPQRGSEASKADLADSHVDGKVSDGGSEEVCSDDLSSEFLKKVDGLKLDCSLEGSNA